jgi:beta-fructofuranosidase
VVSPFGQVIYSIGEFRDYKHHTEVWHTLDHGKDFYATNTYTDENNHAILVGWVKAKGKGPWAGCLSLPREVKLDQQNRLIITPIPELESLRYKHQHFERSLEANSELTGTAPYFGGCVEIKARYQLETAEAVGFTLIDDEDEHQIRYDFASHTLLAVDERAILQFPNDAHRLDLHIFIDQSVIEIFINDRETFTTVFQPRLKEYHTLKIAPFLLNVQGEVALDFWTLKEIGI